MKQIAKSFLLANPQFSVQVAAYAKELLDWNAHMARVDADAKTGVAKEKAHAPYPCPVASDMVKSCVDHETGQVAFQIVDDSASVVQAKRDALLRQVALAEDAEIARIIPQGKRREYNFQLNDIVKADGDRRSAIAAQVGDINTKVAGLHESRKKRLADAPPPSLIDKAKAFVGVGTTAVDTSDIDDHLGALNQQAIPLHERMKNIEAERPAQDAAFIKDHGARSAAIEAVQRWSAKVQSEIEDIDAADVNAFVIPPYKAK